MSGSGRPADEWAGAFGNDYIARNPADAAAIARAATALGTILGRLPRDANVASILEVGANVGINLRALAALTRAELYALEPNARAREILASEKVVAPTRLLDGTADCIALADSTVDLVFTSGTLIHIPPDDLLTSCAEIHRVARRFVLSIEYFADRPEEKRYRDRAGLMFKRDFGAFWLDNFPALALIDYGFLWRRATGLDNLTWWLFAKGAPA